MLLRIFLKSIALIFFTFLTISNQSTLSELRQPDKADRGSSSLRILESTSLNKSPDLVQLKVTRKLMVKKSKSSSTTITQKRAGERATRKMNLIKCGEPSVTPNINYAQLRIIGGDAAYPNSWPWLVSIREYQNNKFYHICAGSLISRKYVITAAHCLYGRKNKTFAVVIGVNELSENVTFKNNFFIDRIIIHPKFKNEFNDDIALLELHNPVNFGEKASPICLPVSNNPTLLYKHNVIVIGWGSTTGFNSQKTLSDKLLQATLQIKNHQNKTLCKGYDDKNYCALDNDLKQSNICFGDSGGSLMHLIGNKWYLYGISSFVYEDAQTKKCLNGIPSFYTIVPKYLNWIRSYVKL